MEQKLKFKGTWRTYQQRVLQRADDYIRDGKIHIVAAPGSGKTTLGIELIGRIGRPALILAPSITIREQWLERIREAFLPEGIQTGDFLSNDLKHPKFITVATYQALHSAVIRFQGALEEDEEDDSDDTALAAEKEVVDYSSFDLTAAMQAAGIATICLDECHHLRSEWWKALESFRKAFPEAKIISLTATPPYDATPAMWKRYLDMCGEIDEEITIPELVKEGSLCAHQDYVYFNYPTKEETGEITKFRENSEAMLQKLMTDPSLAEVIKTHSSLYGGASEEALLDKPAYLASLLIYLQAKQIAFPKKLQRLLGAGRLPGMEEKWMEYLLQGLLYDDTESFVCDKVYREQLTAGLKAAGLLEKKKVCMTAGTSMQKLLIRSRGKMNSIREIVFHEYETMETELRLLILTDYIRKECERNLGNPEVEMNQLGVLPFFEMLRRENDASNMNLRLGVLCGSMVIIPGEARRYLAELAGEERVSFSKAGMLPESDYLVVNAVGDAHFLTAAVTELFTKGYIEVLIGTKSLLGEGWDAPCVNSLILASFVGSFMLSNQMRGRAIRVDKNNPDKTSNIWHLVCLNPAAKSPGDGQANDSEDFKLLKRRMEHFMGLHYEEDTIENGVARLSVIQPPYNHANVERINKKMIVLSEKRSLLKARWDRSLAILNQVEIADEVDISERIITVASFYDALRDTAIAGAILLLIVMLRTVFGGLGILGFGITLAAAAGFVCLLIRAIGLKSPLRRLKIFGNGIRRAMLEKGLLESENCKVVVQSAYGIFHAIYLMGGSGREKTIFAKSVSEFFSEIDNQRYLLVREKGKHKLDGYFAVPDAFAKKKEDAQAFAGCMRPFMGNYDLVYTRSEAGRKILLDARVRALGNREERCLGKKKAKGALE